MADTVESLASDIANLQSQIVVLEDKRLALLDPESQTQEAKIATYIYNAYRTLGLTGHWLDEKYESNGVMKQDWNGPIHKIMTTKAQKCLEVTGGGNIRKIVDILINKSP